MNTETNKTGLQTKIEHTTIFYFGIGLLISFLLWQPIGISFGYALLIGYTLWTIIYFLILFKHFWIIVNANYGVVLQNYFVEQKTKLTDAEITDKLFVPEGQRALLEGIHPKFPWETIVGEPIHLIKVTDGGKKMIVVDKRNIRYEINYVIPMTPTRDEVGLIRFGMVTEEIAKNYFQSVVEASIRKEYIKVENGEAIFKNWKEFSRDTVENIFGGYNVITSKERQYGRFTNTPLIENIRKDDSGQKIAEIDERAKQIRTGFVKIRGKKSKIELDANMVGLLTAIAAGQDLDLRQVNLTGVRDGTNINLGPRQEKRQGEVKENQKHIQKEGKKK